MKNVAGNFEFSAKKNTRYNWRKSGGKSLEIFQTIVAVGNLP
jgi:hypothetical protein